jgi:hypothetical protein
MPVTILDLGKQFRQSTTIVYPPFKNGKYMEEYFYDYIIENKDTLHFDRVYIPIFWTNLQTHKNFSNDKAKYETLLLSAMSKMPPNTKYFTIVQHDDGPLLKMIGDVLVFGACTGNIPLPLIYEDKTNKLTTKQLENAELNLEKKYLASFIGSRTHTLRTEIYNILKDKSDIFMGVNNIWTNNISQNASDVFIEKTSESKFCLAPRGYGRSSFRFFEAIQLGVIPVYFWNDIEWLPYKNIIDYSKFTVSIHEKDIRNTYNILRDISDEKYISMIKELERVRHYFTLDGMCEYIVSDLSE